MPPHPFLLLYATDIGGQHLETLDLPGAHSTYQCNVCPAYQWLPEEESSWLRRDSWSLSLLFLSFCLETSCWDVDKREVWYTTVGIFQPLECRICSWIKEKNFLPQIDCGSFMFECIFIWVSWQDQPAYRLKLWFTLWWREAVLETQTSSKYCMILALIG